MAASSTTNAAAAGTDGGLQVLDAYTAVYSATREPQRLSLLHTLLAALQWRSGGEEEQQQQQRRRCGGGTGPYTSRCSVLDALQNCCQSADGCREVAKGNFITVWYALHSVAAARETSRGALAHLLAGVPDTVCAACLAATLGVETAQLQMMDALGQQRLQQQQERAKQQQHCGIVPFLQIAIESFRVVTRDTLPKCLYSAFEPLLCELPYSWLLNCVFANTPMRLIGTAEGFRTAKEQLELRESSLRFLLSAESTTGDGDATAVTGHRKQLQELLSAVTAMQSALSTDAFVVQLADEWRAGVEAIRYSFAAATTPAAAEAAITTPGAHSPVRLVDALDTLLQLTPHSVAYGVAHCFRLPLPPVVDMEPGGVSDAVPEVVAVLGASFDGMSLEEVELLLQPSDSDHGAAPGRRADFTVRLYTHFHGLFVLLLNACCLQGADVAVLPSPFFNTHASPFVRAVHPARLDGMARCHCYALFDVLVEASWPLRAVIVVGGGSWVSEARVFFAQWLTERNHAEPPLCVIFKQTWEDAEEEWEEQQGKERRKEETVELLLLPLLQRIVADTAARVMLLIPASGTALLSRRYGRYQLLQQRSDGVVREMRETYDGAEEVEKKKQRGSALLQVAEVASRPVFAALLQRTVMPVVSYSVCGGVPLAYVCDATDVAGTWVEPTLAVSLPVGGG